MVGELSVGPPLGVDPVWQMRLRIQNKQTNKQTNIASILVVPIDIIDGQHTDEISLSRYINYEWFLPTAGYSCVKCLKVIFDTNFGISELSHFCFVQNGLLRR